MQCTPDDDFNHSLWIDLNGSNCEVEFTWENKYIRSESPRLSRGARGISSGDAYTCNCTGDYSFLDKLGGIRVGNLQSSQAVLNTLILAICMPILGTYVLIFF